MEQSDQHLYALGLTDSWVLGLYADRDDHNTIDMSVKYPNIYW